MNDLAVPKEDLSQIMFSQSFDFESLAIVPSFKWKAGEVPFALVSTVGLADYFGIENFDVEVGARIALGDLLVEVVNVGVYDDPDLILVERAEDAD